VHNSDLLRAGCFPKEIAAITAHKMLAEVERYTRAADQVRLALNGQAGAPKGKVKNLWYQSFANSPAAELDVETQ
jgi:hypothetical protein